MKTRVDFTQKNKFKKNEYEVMYKILDIAFTQLNSKWQGVACNEFIKKINEIHQSDETNEEKYFKTVIALFVAYKATYSSLTWSSFPAQLNLYINQFASKILDAESIKQTTPFEQYSYERMIRVVQVLSGVINNDVFWKKHNSPQGVKHCATLLKTQGCTPFEKWYCVTKHITSLANTNLTDDERGLFSKEGRDDKTEELYTAIFKQSLLDPGFKLSFHAQAWDDPERTKSPKKNKPYKQITLPILRLETIEDFVNVPLELQKSICSNMGVNAWEIENFTIQIIENDEQYAGHYIDRIDSIQSGVHLLLATLPEDHVYKFQARKLNLYLSEVAEDCKKTLDQVANKSIEYYQHSLVNYLQFTLNTLQSVTGYSEDKLTHYLSRAEEFALLINKKPALCTITKIFDSQDEYCVLIDKPILPISQEIHDDFRATIKFWPNKEYIEDLIIHTADGDVLCLKKGSKINYPEWFLEGYDDIEKTLQVEVLRKIQLEKNLDEYFPINAISSKLRILPGPANFQLHRLITYIKKENSLNPAVLKEHRPEIRASHIGSRDIKNPVLRQYHAETNLHQLINEAKKWLNLPKQSVDTLSSPAIPVLFQTLISPPKISMILGTPDVDLHEDKRLAVEKFKNKPVNKSELIDIFEIKDPDFEVISTNHPYNYGKHISYTNSNSPTTYPAIIRLIELARKLNPDDADILLTNSVNELESLAKTDSSFILFSEYRELHLSALEQLVTAFCGGISFGGCVSGKDRKAVEIIYANAMRIYFEKYGSLFKWEDTAENNLKFSKIVAALYGSKHMHINAGQNSPGANGLKDSNYFPVFLVKAIEEWHLVKAKRNQKYKKYDQYSINPIKQSDLFASNNELDVIIKTQNQHFHESSWIAPAKSHLEFIGSSQINWNKIIDSACMWITKSNRKASELEIAYEELLTSPKAGFDQKIITLSFLFTSEIKELDDFKINVCRSMGFVSLLDARSTFNKIALEKGYLKTIGSSLKKLELTTSNCTIQGVETIKLEFNKLFPEKENFLHHSELTRGALTSIRVYNQSGKASGIGLPRGYAYANLLETLAGVDQKIVILCSLMKANKANRWFTNFGANQNDEKPLNIQQYVCSGLKVDSLDGVKKNIHCAYKRYKDKVPVNKVEEIAVILDNYPTLAQIKKIKKDLNTLFPSLANARTEHLIEDLAQLIKQGCRLLTVCHLLERNEKSEIYQTEKWTKVAFSKLHSRSIPSILAYSLVLIQELTNRNLLPSRDEMLIEQKALYSIEGTGFNMDKDVMDNCILYNTLLLLQDKPLFINEFSRFVKFEELNGVQYKALSSEITWKSLHDLYWSRDSSIELVNQTNLSI